MKFLTIYVEFENCKLVVFASAHIIMSFACKGGLTLCDVLNFFLGLLHLHYAMLLNFLFNLFLPPFKEKNFLSKKLEKKCSKNSQEPIYPNL
jgi:hypothetical protein